MKERILIMMNEKLMYLFVFFSLFNFGCSKTVYETIKSNPSQADIYLGKTSSNLEKTKYKTPFNMNKIILHSKYFPDFIIPLDKKGESFMTKFLKPKLVLEYDKLKVGFDLNKSEVFTSNFPKQEKLQIPVTVILTATIMFLGGILIWKLN